MEEYCINCFKVMDRGLDTCPKCGFDFRTEQDNPLYLPSGILHNQYLIGRVLGKGGFGITYLCYDINLKRKVAIKEYLPTDFASRETKSKSVIPYSGEKKEYFIYGKENFIKEAQTLAGFSHPNIIKVYSYFEAHNTAYFVMEYLEGKTLREYVKERGKIAVQSAIEIVKPILDALEEIHSKNYYHRDIKPANIYITEKKVPILIDFGATRQQLAGQSKSLTAILTPGYAPIEQYSSKGKQGAWTDIYALSATMYYMITGRVPPESQDRREEEELIIPSKLGIKITPGWKSG